MGCNTRGTLQPVALQSFFSNPSNLQRTRTRKSGTCMHAVRTERPRRTRVTTERSTGCECRKRCSSKRRDENVMKIPRIPVRGTATWNTFPSITSFFESKETAFLHFLVGHGSSPIRFELCGDIISPQRLTPPRPLAPMRLLQGKHDMRTQELLVVKGPLPISLLHSAQSISPTERVVRPNETGGARTDKFSAVQQQSKALKKKCFLQQSNRCLS